jgi:SAM-dependent methyltransferase
MLSEMSGTEKEKNTLDGYSREEVTCVICGVQDADVLFNAPERIVKCRRCGLVYVSPRLDTESLAKVYSKDYFVSDADDPGVDYKAYANYISDEKVILRSMNRRMKKVEKYAPRKGRVLDVGCAAAFSLLAAQQRGWEAEGIEYSDFCVDYARSRGLSVHHGGLDSFQGSPESFEAITMWDYLEHSSNPLEELKTCNRLLKDRGVLVLSIPNVDSWSYSLLKEKWIGFKNIEHFYFYSRKTLSRIAEMAGLKLEHSFYQGKYLSLSFFLSRVQYYTDFKPLLGAVENVANCRLANNISFYLNPFDILNVVLRKKDHMD